MTKRLKETRIESHRSWFYVDWSGLVQHQDLLGVLVRKEFLAKYQQTLLGPIWFLAQPILTTLMFTVIFSRFAKMSTDGVSPVLFYLCGLSAWGYFAQCFQSISLSLVQHSHIFSKVYFPRIIVPLSVVVSSGMTYLLQMGLFILLYVFSGFLGETDLAISLGAPAWILFLFLQTAGLSLGVGLWVASLSVKYRDLQHVLGFLIQLWMYATPIIYPLSLVPDRWRWVVMLNPLSSVMEGYRWVFFGTGQWQASDIFLSLGVTLAILLSGLFVFNQIERNFVDTI